LVVLAVVALVFHAYFVARGALLLLWVGRDGDQREEPGRRSQVPGEKKTRQKAVFVWVVVRSGTILPWSKPGYQCKIWNFMGFSIYEIVYRKPMREETLPSCLAFLRSWKRVGL
jgi:hypothetical protein